MPVIPLESARPLNTHPAFDSPDAGDIAVVFCHFNPCKYRAPERNLGPFLDGLFDLRVPVYAAELRCGRSLESDPVLPASHPRVIQLTSRCVFFQKENLWNLVAARLPAQYRKVVCLDADLIMRPSTWFHAVSQALDDAPLVHPHSRAILLNRSGDVEMSSFSVGYAVGTGQWTAEKRIRFHPGRSIAARRDLWETAGGLYNTPIGGGDQLLLWAVLGATSELRPYMEAVSQQYSDHYQRWAARIREWSGGQLGYVTADAYHLWHGSNKNRQYFERVRRMTGYDPTTDIAPNPDTGLPEWSDAACEKKAAMIAAVEAYFATRREDE